MTERQELTRVLFVDDEPAVLQGLGRALRRMRHRWQMHFAESGDAAMRLLATTPIDVLVTDLRLPGMDGAALLERVRREYPEVVRLVLSGHGEAGRLTHAQALAHAHLSKPSEAEDIEHCVEHCWLVHQRLHNPRLRQAAADMEHLAPPPSLFRQLTELAENEDVSATAITQLLERESATAARVLELANAPWIGHGNRANDAVTAVNILGPDRLRTLALAAALFSAHEGDTYVAGFSPPELQHHSVQIAKLATALLDTEPQRLLAYAAAMLHDIGLLAASAHRSGQLEASLQCARARGIALHSAEEELHGFSHADLGAFILARWGVAYPLVEVVLFHHAPRLASHRHFDALGAVHVAEQLLTSGPVGTPPTPPFYTGAIDTGYLASVGVSDRLPQWQALAREVSVGLVES